MNQRIDITGQRFGRWTAMEFASYSKGTSQWLCRCDCGAIKEVSRSHLQSGNTQSCGCLKKEKSTTHGLHKHPMYRTWAGMLSRCRNPKDSWYHRYGGRGIKVCARWHDFAAFYADVGNRPEGMTLDRIDNNGDYAPENVRWASHKQQSETKTQTNRYLTMSGKTKTLRQWCKELGLRPDTVHQRLHRGWSVKEALTTKVQKGH